MRKNKENNEKKKKRKCRLWLAILGIIVILSNLFAIYNILLLGPIEEVIRYIIIGIFVVFDILIIFKVKSKRRHKEKKARLLTFFLIIYLLINCAISGLIMYAYGTLSSINRDYVTYSSSLIVKSNSDIEDVKDLKDNKALDFANKYYDKKDDVGYYWKQYLENIKFNDKIKNQFEESFNKYKLSLEEYLKEFSEDMELFSKMNMENFSFEMSDTFNTRGLMKIIGSFIGGIGAVLLFILGTTNPAGWIVSGVGLVVGLLGGLFKSKEKKIQEATDKLYNSIIESIEKNESKHINDICDNFSNSHKDITKKIDRSINNLCKYLDSIHNNLRKINHKIAGDLEYLNKVYAYRIINYANKKEIVEIDIEKLHQINVSRNYGKSIKITSMYNFNKDIEDRITKVIQEKVIFEKIK